MLGVRASSFSESSLGEPEQDANSALTELDKALRSEKIGEQCEAIVRFPRLFEKYPFPILINSSLLKLADVFRVGNNFLRLWVLRVCQQSEKHLDKIINVDEFVRRIYSVIHSNDPVARALTLRTLGSVAGIIPERQQVHHSIRNSLDSHDEVEVNATIYAAMQFAAQSKTFAVSMCNKISDMIQGLSTPARMKLQLIPILQHMHHDTATATMVRQLCTKLLPSYPAEEFVLVTLNTLTRLASASLVHIPSQVTLLLEYLRTDPRWAVKALALRNLHSLAGEGAHLWPPDSVASMVAVALNEPNERFLGSVLDVLLVLAKSPATCMDQLLPGSPLMELCDYSCYIGNPAIATKGIQVMSRVVRYCSKEDLPVHGLSAMVSKIESVFLLITIIKSEPLERELKVCLNCAVSLCKVHNDLCPRVVALIGSTLMESDSMLHVPLLCEALGAIGDLKPRSLLGVLPDILAKLAVLSEIREPKQEESQTKVMLCTLVFQTMTDFQWDARLSVTPQQPSVIQQLPSVSQPVPEAMDQSSADGSEQVPTEGGMLILTPEMLQVLADGMLLDPADVKHPQTAGGKYQPQSSSGREHSATVSQLLPKQVIDKVVLSTNLWANYRIARSAARYSHHAVAAGIYKHLHEQVSSEHLHFWLKALQELSLGEAALVDRAANPNLVDRLGLAMVHYCKAVVALKAASTPASSLQFQTEYTRLRLEFLQCLTQLVHTCHSLCTTPPPACATVIAENNLQRYGHITNQLRKCVKEFRTCGEMYWKLYQSAFDADPASLANIQILQQMCVLMAHSVERVAQSNYQDEAVLDFSCEHSSLEIQYLISCCQKACGVAQQLVWNEEQKTINHQHIACLLQQVDILADSSLCLPRYFFQVLQSTTVTLMVTPKPRVLGESITVMNNSQLAVKVEGVIQHGKRPGLFRSVNQVMVTVTSQLQKQYTHDVKGRDGRDSDAVMTQTISPHRDFFTAQFLLAFPVGGQYVLQVEAAVVDDKSNVWRTGSKVNLAVKSLEDSKAAGQAAGASRANFPVARF